MADVTSMHRGCFDKFNHPHIVSEIQALYNKMPPNAQHDQMVIKAIEGVLAQYTTERAGVLEQIEKAVPGFKQRMEDAAIAAEVTRKFEKRFGKKPDAAAVRAAVEETGGGEVEAKAEPAEAPALSRTAPITPGLPVAEVQARVDRLTKGWGVKPTVVATVNKLPTALRNYVMKQGAVGDVQGVFDPKTGEVYVIAQSIGEKDNLRAIVLHEVVGHKGFEAVLSEGGMTLSDLARAVELMDKAGNPRIREALAAVKKTHGEKLDAITRGREVVAWLAQHEPKHGIMRRVIAAIQHGLRRLGIVKHISDGDIIDMLRIAQQRVEQGEAMGVQDGAPAVMARRSQDDAEDGRPVIDTKPNAIVRSQQNRMAAFEKAIAGLKRIGVNISEAGDVVMHENLMPSRIFPQIKRFMDHTVEPFVGRVAKSGFSLKDVEQYALAVHAAEANEVIRQRTNNPEATAYDWDDEKAAAVLAEYDAKPGAVQLKQFAKELNRIAAETLRTQKAAGIPVAEGNYDHYVPVRGAEKDQKRGTGRGLKNTKDQLKRKGHAAREEFVLENIIKMREFAVRRVAKNKVNKALLQFGIEAKDPRLMTIDVPQKFDVANLGAGSLDNPAVGEDMREKHGRVAPHAWVVEYQDSIARSFATESAADRYVEKEVARGAKMDDFLISKSHNGMVVWAASPQLEDNEVQAFLNGYEVRMQLTDENLARAATNSEVERLGTTLGVARSIMNFLSKAYTGWNPEWTLRNVIRDAIAGTVNVTGDHGTKVAARVLAKYGKAVAALIESRKDFSKHPWVREFTQAGGMIGPAWLGSLEQIGADAQSVYNEAIGARATYLRTLADERTAGRSRPAAHLKAAAKAGAAGYKSVPMLGHFLRLMERVNTVSENAFRLALFQTLREDGYSPAKAAYAAKNSTLNFDRKGEQTAVMGSLWLFYNPSVQGVARTIEALTKSKHKGQAQALTGMLVAAGFALAQSMRSGGDDEEREWLAVNQDTKNRNLIIGLGGKTLAAIPMPYEYAVFVSMGYALSDLVSGSASTGQAAFSVANSLAESTIPFGKPFTEDGEFSTAQLSPTLLKMGIAPQINQNAFGNPLYPRKFDDTRPDVSMAWRGTHGSIYEKAAVGLKKMTGGNEYDLRGIDISPETLKFYTQTVAGGAGAFFAKLANAGFVGFQGVMPELREVPFAGSFVREQGVRDARTLFYAQAKEAKAAASAFNAAKKAADTGAMRDILDDGGPLIPLARSAEKIADAAAAKRKLVEMVKANDKLSLTERRARIDELERQEEQYYGRFFDTFRVTERRRK